eukprot:366569-Chlamydomonas_euryale.AAC.33
MLLAALWEAPLEVPPALWKALFEPKYVPVQRCHLQCSSDTPIDGEAAVASHSPPRSCRGPCCGRPAAGSPWHRQEWRRLSKGSLAASAD